MSAVHSQARVFQSSKCALTGALLELPAVHFLCGHAFNLRSLGENDRECPLCAPQFRAILDIRNSLRAGAAEQARATSVNASVTVAYTPAMRTVDRCITLSVRGTGIPVAICTSWHWRQCCKRSSGRWVASLTAWDAARPSGSV